MEEQIIKKEEKLHYKSGLFTKSGELVLTNSELFFTHKGEKLLAIPLKKIISTNTQKYQNVNWLYVFFKDENGKENKAMIMRYGVFEAIALGNLSRLGQLKESYFTAWAQAIDDTRLGRHGTSTHNFSIADELKKLNDLLKEGIISQSDFDNQKKKLLD